MLMLTGETLLFIIFNTHTCKSVIIITSEFLVVDHLNGAARADLAWWRTFLVTWNGMSIMPPTSPSVIVVSDASSSWGCGAIHSDLSFQLQWSESWASVKIAPTEL